MIEPQNDARFLLRPHPCSERKMPATIRAKRAPVRLVTACRDVGGLTWCHFCASVGSIGAIGAIGAIRSVRGGSCIWLGIRPLQTVDSSK